MRRPKPNCADLISLFYLVARFYSNATRLHVIEMTVLAVAVITFCKIVRCWIRCDLDRSALPGCMLLRYL